MKRGSGLRRAHFAFAVAIASCAAGAPALTAQSAPDGAPVRAGTLERIRVYGTSLEGNLAGDDPTRDVVVYLPSSYAAEPTRHFPVVYFLHGYTVGVETYVGLTGLPGSADLAIAAGAEEMILVLPDAFTIYSGSMYSNSPTTGNWEGYVAHDLVAYIDSHYRTIPERESRGLSGHSMGGYGTMRIGMKHPEVFSVLYAMSSCCLMNNPSPAQGRGAAAPDAGAPAPAGRGGGFSNALFAQAAAWAPNPQNPPRYFDLYNEDGVFRPEIAAKWVAHSPLVMVDQYVPNLKRYSAIAMDVGDADPLGAANHDLDAALTRLEIGHSFEEYEGTHTNRVRARFQSNVLPFFSEQLAATTTGR
ncbi:MAG: alpha/beta hydrolase-fold protein [Gemmatimonadota bacterium]